MNTSSTVISLNWFRRTSGRLSITALALGVVLLATLTATRAQEQQELSAPLYTVLYTFTGGADGANPYGFSGIGLIRDKRGNLYGTTLAGGDLTSCPGAGCGVVFEVDPTGKETVLHTFSGPDGASPEAAPVRDDAGNLYGTTNGGGSGFCTGGCGVVFKVDPTGKETVLHSFTAGADGAFPVAGVTLDKAGNLYGTTFLYGTFLGGPAYGVAYKLDPTGKETVLHTFTGGSDGSQPYAGLVPDEDGNLYGTTFGGGAHAAGVVYKLDPTGKETVLYSFTGGNDGAYPFAGLVRDEGGNLYGTTSAGGDLSCPSSANPGCGVVYKLDPRGKESVLYSFSGGTDGNIPAGGVLWRAGNLYGTTSAGGDSGGCGGLGCGVIFKVDRNGKEKVLYTFTGSADGGSPLAGLISNSAGDLFGTTAYFGDLASTNPNCSPGFGCGVVFKLKLRPE
jgi:uncharacterized repeat protein (TIGR03803 family)